MYASSSPEEYDLYSKNIRKEYSFYSQADYNAGRKHVLESFLQMDKIYKSGYFLDNYEK